MDLGQTEEIALGDAANLFGQDGTYKDYKLKLKVESAATKDTSEVIQITQNDYGDRVILLGPFTEKFNPVIPVTVMLTADSKLFYGYKEVTFTVFINNSADYFISGNSLDLEKELHNVGDNVAEDGSKPAGDGPENEKDADADKNKGKGRNKKDSDADGDAENSDDDRGGPKEEREESKEKKEKEESTQSEDETDAVISEIKAEDIREIFGSKQLNGMPDREKQKVFAMYPIKKY